MIYICCDMNCNNFGNYFKVVAHEREIKKDNTGYMYENTHYPADHCYRAKPPHPIQETFRYSEAIDILCPEEYTRWKNTRFGKLKKIFDELQARENRKSDYLSRMDLMVILDILMYG